MPQVVGGLAGGPSRNSGKTTRQRASRTPAAAAWSLPDLKTAKDLIEIDIRSQEVFSYKAGFRPKACVVTVARSDRRSDFT